MNNFVFDLYGTLVDIRTDEYSQKFKNKYLKYLNKVWGADGTFFENLSANLSAYSGFDEPDFVPVLHDAINASGGNITLRGAVEAAKKFRILSTRKLKLYRGVKRLLKELKARGAKLYLLSNAQAAFTVYELKKLGLYDYFDGIVLSSEFGQKKPSPAFFSHIIKKYSLNVSKTVFTGNDLTCDIVPAKQAGMYAVYTKTDISPSGDDLAEAGKIADFAADSFSAVANHLMTLLKDSKL